MTQPWTQHWQGASTRRYLLEVREPAHTWSRTGGIYIFARRTESGWVPRCIGETGDLSAAIPDHPEWSRVDHLGESYVHVYRENNEFVRRNVEFDLRSKWNLRRAEAANSAIWR
ncbi:MAG: hypothetical protein O3C10_10310 [Chloroflexi bacterium]|nr:hypothetical protein [Chloroflexota bacterium]